MPPINTSTKAMQPLMIAIVFLCVLSGHILSPVTTSTDSYWSVPIALGILRDGKVDVNEYESLKQPRHDYRIIKVGDREQSYFPLSTHMFAVPVVALCMLWQDKDQILKNRLFIEKATASIIVALTAIFIYLIARRTLDTKWSFILVIIFAYCTPAWSTASRALWQHGPSMLMLAISLYLLLKPDLNRRTFFFLGVTLALSYVLRPTNSISVLVLATFVLFYYPSNFPAFVLGGSIVAVSFVVINLHIYNQLLPPYYSSGRLYLHSQVWKALIGNLVSPSRGLLVYCPVFLGSIYGLYLKLRNRQPREIAPFLAAIIIVHWFAISCYPHWWAGYSFGPRFFSDLVPYFVYFLIPVCGEISDSLAARKIILGMLFFVLVLSSFFIHFRGATDRRTWEWNSTPINVDADPSRLWSWRDLQFMRGLSE
jgi:hypothetical protein